MKKLLSIILIAAMLISLVPAVFAADAGIKIVYDFYNEDLAKLVADVEFDLNDLSYTASEGFWRYADDYNNRGIIKTNKGTGFRTSDGYVKAIARNVNIANQAYWVGFELYVPKAGNYEVKITAEAASYHTATWLEAYIFKTESVTDASEGVIQDNKLGSKGNRFVAEDVSEEHTVGTKYFDAGKYYFVFMPSTDRTASGAATSGGYVFLKKLTLTEGDGSLTVPIISSLTATGNQVTATAAKMSDNTEASDVAYSYAVADDDTALAEVDANGVVTGLADGTATIIATATKNGQSSSKSIEVAVTAPPAEPEEDEELSDAFDDAVASAAPSDYIAPSVDAIDAEGIVGEPIKSSNGAYKITAPETAEERGNFLYWKKAMTVNEKIVSFDREFDYVPEGEGRNILIAVYEGDVKSTTAKCYNANGQYLPNTAPVEADLPSMAGFGKASEWKQYGETNVYVAQYGATTPIAGIDVTVNGDNTSGGGTNLAYGEKVTCTATGENFKCWKKTYGDGTAKIVSIEKVYSFKAWEDCTVTAVYAENVHYTGAAMKIIIDSFAAGGENGIMAEFLGFGNNVVEKGIMFNGARIAMTTPSNQFSVIADEAGTYAGYAIVEEDGSLKLITDGSYEHTK